MRKKKQTRSVQRHAVILSKASTFTKTSFVYANLYKIEADLKVQTERIVR